MNIEIKYQPAYSLAIVKLNPEESIQAEAGAMVSMSSNMTVETAMKGGVLGAITRSVLGGETLFANTFTSKGAPGEITLAPSLPGDIGTLQMTGGTLYVQSGSFLAGAPNLNLDLKWGGAKTFFGSEGLFLLRASGTGPIILCSYGAIHKVSLDGSRSYLCDTGHVVAFTEGLSFDVRRVGGWKSTLLSGEGLVCEFRGAGDLYMQTRSTQAFLSWLIPRIPGRSGGGGGNAASGILGNILRGD
ncbi:MAG TPA: TIGR00266 family protein [Candidatus Polarisedimenticolia bacterium]|nr:TIGR00266 family protein [Candidatus Polarisedimenticolia bacterium]